MLVCAEKTFQGAWRISAIVDGYRIEKQYFWFTKKEALNAFRNDLKKRMAHEN